MAANANPKLSTITSPAGAVPDDLPVAHVSRDLLGGFKVEFGDDETIGAPGDDLPFAVQKKNGKVPHIKSFGSLFGCDGGTLTIGETTYRIQKQQANGKKCFRFGVDIFKSSLANN